MKSNKSDDICSSIDESSKYINGNISSTNGAEKTHSQQPVRELIDAKVNLSCESSPKNLCNSEANTCHGPESSENYSSEMLVNSKSIEFRSNLNLNLRCRDNSANHIPQCTVGRNAFQNKQNSANYSTESAFFHLSEHELFKKLVPSNQGVLSASSYPSSQETAEFGMPCTFAHHLGSMIPIYSLTAFKKILLHQPEPKHLTEQASND